MIFVTLKKEKPPASDYGRFGRVMAKLNGVTHYYLVGTPSSAGSYEIVLTLSGNKLANAVQKDLQLTIVNDFPSE